VDYVLWAYRAQPHSVTKFSPHYLMHEREMPGPNDRMLEAYIMDKKKQSNVHGGVKEFCFSAQGPERQNRVDHFLRLKRRSRILKCYNLVFWQLS
jgi:hypothetical protein